jgi:hypothetical protein
MKKKNKQHQVKSRWYYIFWGSMTATVFVGQSLVYSGYMEMATGVNRLTKTLLEFRIQQLEQEIEEQLKDGMTL